MPGTTVSGRSVARFSRGTVAGENTHSSTGSGSALGTFHTSPDLFDPSGQLLHEVVHRAVLANHARDFRGGVNDGGVVAPAELLADLGQRRVGELAREVHRDLARVDDVLRADRKSV